MSSETPTDDGVSCVFDVFQTKTGTDLWLRFTAPRALDFSAWFSNISGVPICLIFEAPSDVGSFCAGVFRALFSHKSYHLIAIISGSNSLQ